MDQYISKLCAEIRKTSSKRTIIEPVYIEEEELNEKDEDYNIEYLIVPNPSKPIIGKDPLISILEKD